VRAIRAAICLAFVLGACGDDDDDATSAGADDPVVAEDDGDDDGGGGRGAAEEDDPYVAAAVESIESDPEFPLDHDAAVCFASHMIGAIGSDNLREAGIDPQDFADEESPDLTELGIELDDDQVDQLASAFTDCDISLAEMFVSDAGPDAPPGLADCIEENLDEERFARIFAEAVAFGDTEENNDAFFELFFGLADACPDLLETG
jgi:hypothetical protein